MPQLEQQAIEADPIEVEPIETESPIAALYQRYAPVILAYVRKHVPCSEDAEDVLLDVFLAALEHDSVFLHLEERQQLAWLRRVAHNKFIDYHRRTRRRPAISLELATEALYDDDEQAPEQVALRHEEHALLRERLARLPDQQQEVLHLRFGADMRCIDIAKLLDRREGTVRAWLSRSLNFLRTVYEK
jgi:RNA polymerase sigma factor (sigma-70 family)